MPSEGGVAGVLGVDGVSIVGLVRDDSVMGLAGGEVSLTIARAGCGW